MPLAHHIIIRMADGRVFLRNDRERRIFARQVQLVGDRYRLLPFGGADTHSHILAACSREEAGLFARSLEWSLNRKLKTEIGFAPALIKPIHDQNHLYTGSRYAMRQDRRHGILVDPLFEATCLPDLLGLRVGFPRFVERVRAMLPRLGLDELHALLPPIDSAVPLDPNVLRVSAAAAVGLPDLVGKSRTTRAARAAAARLAAPELPQLEIGRLLGCSPRQLRRLQDEEIDPALLDAVALQWRLRSQPRRASGAGDVWRRQAPAHVVEPCARRERAIWPRTPDRRA